MKAVALQCAWLAFWLAGCAGGGDLAAAAPDEVATPSGQIAGDDQDAWPLDSVLSDDLAAETAAAPAADAGADLALDTTAVTDADASAAEANDDDSTIDGLDDAAPPTDAGDSGIAADTASPSDVNGPTGGPGKAGGDFLVVVKTNSADGVTMMPLNDGAELPLIYGPQGGYHIWASVCVPKTVATPIKLALTLRDKATGVPIAPSPIKLKTWAKDTVTIPGFRCHPSLTLFVSCPCAISGKPLKMRVDATGNYGKTGWRETSVVAVHGAGPCESPSAPACQPTP